MNKSTRDIEPRRGLTGKLSPPILHAAQIPRTAIYDAVVAADTARIVLFQGPAGFGKSTLMAQCATHFDDQGVTTAWLTLDEADNDIHRFLYCLETTIAPFVAIDADASIAIDPGASVDVTALDLLTRLAEQRCPCVIFIDDFEQIHEPAVLGLVRQLVDHLPPNCRLVLGSRRVPDLGLARLRARGQLLEIDAEQMRFSLSETARFLNDERGLGLTETDLARLHAKTEGWVAALWLASLAMERSALTGQTAPADFIARFSGANRAVADYLAEDVFARQSQRIQDFLLRTSVLRYLSVPLCDALLPTTHSGSLLRLLDEANIFLVPIDGEQRLYRYHSLFADFLRQRLAQTRPAELASLHRAASVWFDDQQRPVPAIDHALAAADHARALRLIAQHAERLLAEGRMRLLGRWFANIPAERLARHPQLQAIHIWALCFTASPHDAMARLERYGLEYSLDPDVRLHVLALRPALLAIMDEFEQAHALGSAALEQLPANDTFARTTLVNTLANACSVIGEHTRARAFLERARDVQGVYESAFNAMYSESVEGIIDLQAGRQRQAAARFRLAARIDRHRGAWSRMGTNGNAWAGVLHAGALYEANDRAQAAQLLNIYAPLAHHIGLPDHMILADVMLARIAFEARDIDKAFQILAELEHTGHERRLPRVVATTRLHRAQLLLLLGDARSARSEIERARDSRLWQRLAPLRLLANDLENLQIADLRWHSLVGDAETALMQLNPAITQAMTQSRQRRAVKLGMLQALALQRRDRLSAALDTLERWLRQGCREGYMRLILDEGPQLGGLVVRLQTAILERKTDRREPLFAEYLQALLQGFGAAVFNDCPAVAEPNAGLLEPLTRKEMRVLKLLAEGHSNSAMAQRLFVSDSTVRTHLRNINGKLNARNRTEAVAIARKVGVV